MPTSAPENIPCKFLRGDVGVAPYEKGSLIGVSCKRPYFPKKCRKGIDKLQDWAYYISG